MLEKDYKELMQEVKPDAALVERMVEQSVGRKCVVLPKAMKAVAAVLCGLVVLAGGTVAAEAQEDLLRLFTVTECAPGYRPAKHGRGRPVSSQKLNTSISQSDGQHRRSAWPQPRTPDCPRAWTCLKKKKKDLFIDGVPGARAGHWSLVGPPSDHCWAQHSFTAVS